MIRMHRVSTCTNGPNESKENGDAHGTRFLFIVIIIIKRTGPFCLQINQVC